MHDVYSIIELNKNNAKRFQDTVFYVENMTHHYNWTVTPFCMLPPASGIVPLACEELFNAIEIKRADAKEGEEYQVLVS